jgi:hypothetical protein
VLVNINAAGTEQMKDALQTAKQVVVVTFQECQQRVVYRLFGMRKMACRFSLCLLQTMPENTFNLTGGEFNRVIPVAG